MRTGLTLAILISSVSLNAPSNAVELIPHQAVYRMSLKGAEANSGVAGAEGAMLYKFEEACDAWTSETKVFLKLLYVGGKEVESTWSFVSWESKDDLAYRFRVRQSRDGTPVEYLQGTVSRNKVEGAAKVDFTSPDGTQMELPQGTMFPTHHLLALIAEGKKGTLTYSRTVFDGASLDNPYTINALITPGATAKSNDESIDERSFKHIRMAFFPISSRRAFPDFELGVDYRANGIANHIVQDFGGFSLDLMPDTIELLERPTC